jgi:hypothetical protein
MCDDENTLTLNYLGNFNDMIRNFEDFSSHHIIKWKMKKEIEYKSTIMEMKNIIKNQERIIEYVIEKDRFLEAQ